MKIFENVKNKIKDEIEMRFVYHKVEKLADAMVLCGIDTHVIDYVDGKIVLVEKH